MARGVRFMAEQLRLLVVADDLTGANDTSVSFAQSSYRTTLLMDPSAFASASTDGVEVFALSTDSRAAGQEAHGRTQNAVATAVGRGFDRIYVKVDSTMRGSVEHQVAGALDGFGADGDDVIAVICPAYPAMGRTITEGVLYVTGTPVHETASGRDPVCPVTTPVMSELLPEAVSLPNPRDAAALSALISGAGARQVVIDAETQEDLDTIAAAAELLDGPNILVGSAGLSQSWRDHLPEAIGAQVRDPLPVGRRPLIVVTSVHETSQQQVDSYIGSHDGGTSIVFSPHPAQMLSPSSLPALKAQLAAIAGSGDAPVIIRANPAQVRSAHEREELAQIFAQALAQLTAGCLDRLRFGALVLIGGDGAQAVLNAIGAPQLTIIRPLVEGVPLGLVSGGDFGGLPVATKSGGFGDESLLSTIMDQVYETEQADIR